MPRCPSTSETIIPFLLLLLCSCLQLKFPTMTSSSFQTSRLKTVSTRRRSFSVSLCVGACVRACVWLYVNICVWVFFVVVVFVPVLVCVCMCVFPCLSGLTFAHTSALWRAAAALWFCRQVHGWVGVSISVCLSLYLSLPSVALTTTEILLHSDLFA